jgi:electron transfer flavoprotein alpha subunit
VTNLVIADHDDAEVKAATLNAVAAAQQIGGDVHVLVAGRTCRGAAAHAARIAGVSRVFLADDAIYAHRLAEPLAALIVSLADGYTHLLHSATTQGKNVMPRVAAMLDVSQLSDISAVVSADTFVRPIFAGGILATVQSKDARKVITVRSSCFRKAELGDRSCEVESIAAAADPAISTFVRHSQPESAGPELTTARIVVAGGRGLGSAHNFQIIEVLASKMGAAIGASRAAVDAGFAPSNRQVGQSGKIVAPELYIAIGISGAIQHLAGIKDARVIVAINKDPEAPIFEVADYRLVADLFQAVPELTNAL